MSCAVTVWQKIKNSLGFRHKVATSYWYVEDDDGVRLTSYVTGNQFMFVSFFVLGQFVI